MTQPGESDRPPAAYTPPVDGLDQDSLVRACMQLARRLREAEVPGMVADFCEDAARWLVVRRRDGE